MICPRFASSNSRRGWRVWALQRTSCVTGSCGPNCCVRRIRFMRVAERPSVAGGVCAPLRGRCVFVFCRKIKIKRCFWVSSNTTSSNLMEWSVPQLSDKEGITQVMAVTGEVVSNEFLVGMTLGSSNPSVNHILLQLKNPILIGLVLIYRNGFVTGSIMSLRMLRMRIHDYVHAWTLLFHHMTSVILCLHFSIQISWVWLAFLAWISGYLIVEHPAMPQIILNTLKYVT